MKLYCSYSGRAKTKIRHWQSETREKELMLAWAAHLWPVGGSKHIASLERVGRVRDTIGHMTVLHVILCSVEWGNAVFVKAFNTRYCWRYRNTNRPIKDIQVKHTLNINCTMNCIPQCNALKFHFMCCILYSTLVLQLPILTHNEYIHIKWRYKHFSLLK